MDKKWKKDITVQLNDPQHTRQIAIQNSRVFDSLGINKWTFLAEADKYNHNSVTLPDNPKNNAAWSRAIANGHHWKAVSGVLTDPASESIICGTFTIKICNDRIDKKYSIFLKPNDYQINKVLNTRSDWPIISITYIGGGRQFAQEWFDWDEFINIEPDMADELKQILERVIATF